MRPLLRDWTQSQKPCTGAVGLSPPSCSALSAETESVEAAAKDWRWFSTGSFFSSSSRLRDLCVNDALIVNDNGTPGLPQVTLTYGYDSTGNATNLDDSFGGLTSYTDDNLNQFTE